MRTPQVSLSSILPSVPALHTLQAVEAAEPVKILNHHLPSWHTPSTVSLVEKVILNLQLYQPKYYTVSKECQNQVLQQKRDDNKPKCPNFIAWYSILSVTVRMRGVILMCMAA